MYHKPVLLTESIEGLAIRPDGIYVDLTFGGGGHSRAILDRLENGHLYAFDQDEDALVNLSSDPRFTFIAANFRFFTHFLQYHAAWPVDGILADLGVSSHQFDTAGRGFSSRFDAPLDMRMNRTQGRTAADILADSDRPELIRIFREYGEIQHAGALATAILKRRQEKPIATTLDLRETALPLAPPRKENQYLAKVFQALRIEVNQELSALKEMLMALPASLKPGGRVAIITYHSLEDRMVKHFLKTGNLDGLLEKDFFGKPLSPFSLVTRKAITPEEAEIQENPRARSARLRIAARNDIQ